MPTNYATEGSTGANFDRVTDLAEFQTGLRQRGTNSRDYIYVVASGAIAAAASVKVTQSGDTWQAVSGAGQHVADVALADGQYGWVRQRFSLPDEAEEVDFDDTNTSWGVDDLQAAIEYINDNFSLGSHTHALDDLSDVTITSATANDVLSWSGTAWVNQQPVLTLESLTDVTLTSVTANDTLVWNGSAWVNQPENAHGHTLSDISDAGVLAGLDTISDDNWSGTDLAVTNGGTGASDASTARTNLGVAIGSNVQAYDAVLDSLSANSDGSGTLEKTGADTVGTYTVSTAGKALIDDASASDQRTTLGLGALAVEDTVGTALLDNNSVTNVELADMAQATIKGRQAGSGTGNPEDLTAAQVKTILAYASTDLSDTSDLMRLSTIDGDKGDITVSSSGATWTIDNDVVTYAKIQNVSATSRVLGRITAGAGDTEELTGSNVRTIAGLATTDSPQFTGIELGHATDTTLARSSAGNLTIEGNLVYRAGGTDVPVTDGGTGASTAVTAAHNLLDGVSLTDVGTPSSTDLVLLQDASDSSILKVAQFSTFGGGGGGGIPIGSVIAYGGTAAPTDYLLCYGQNVSRTTYADLFTAISTTYGVGDGSTTFGIPDLRGRVVAGQDDMGGSSANRLTSPLNGDTLGASGGAESVTLSTAEMPAHVHNETSDTTGTSPFLEASGTRSTGGTPDTNYSTTSTGGGGAHANIQPTLILNYIIYAGA